MKGVTVKRVIIFLLLIALGIVIFKVDSVIFKLIAALLFIATLYFVIFMRSTTGEPPNYDPEDIDMAPSRPPVPRETNEGTSYGTEEEGFVIIKKGTQNLVPVTDSIFQPGPDVKERFEEIANETLPSELSGNEQFNFVLDKVLTIIQRMMHAYSVVMFWYHKKNEKISIERFASSSTDLTPKHKFEVEDDFISQIMTTGVPQLLNSISPSAEADVIRYYKQSQGIRSVIGVPIYYNEKLIGALVLDAKVSDTFGMETIYELGRFVRLITIMISLFEERFLETLSKTRLKGILQFMTPVNSVKSERDVFRIVKESIATMFEWDAFAFVYYEPEEEKFIVAETLNKTSLQFVGPTLEVDMKRTLVGKSLASGTPALVEDTSNDSYKRFNTNEEVSFEGSFLCVPLVYQSQVYGALCFESLRKNAYAEEDVRYVKSIASVLGFIVYSYSVQVALKNLGAYDFETKLYNKKMFRSLLAHELEKNNLVQLPSTLALLKVDDFIEQESLFEESPMIKVVQGITELLKTELASTCLFGRISERIFAIYFFNTTANDVYLLAEKVRVKIARISFPSNSARTSYTVSIGVASCTGRSSVDEAFTNAQLALDKAVNDGGNKTTNIN